MRKDKDGRLFYDQICSASEFASFLKKHFDFVTCVPDSIYKQVLPHLPNCEFASRENHSVSMAFGATIAGRNSAVLMQNSGIGLALDALIGTFELYGQGCLIVVSNRGQLEWEEIQHQYWGKITEDLLYSMGFQLERFHEVGLNGLPDIAHQVANQNKIVFLTIQRGNLNE